MLAGTMRKNTKREEKLDMLKIRDDVDLEELEKFELKKYEYTHLLILRKEEHDFASIDIRNGRYEILDLCNLTYNLTYDLIKAELVEKGVNKIWTKRKYLKKQKILYKIVG